MSRNSSQKLRDLNHFREEGGGGGDGIRGGRRECLCARQTRNTRNGEFSNTACAVYLNQAEGKKNYHTCGLSSKLDPRRLKGAKNQWVASLKARNACAVNPLRQSIQSRGGPSYA